VSRFAVWSGSFLALSLLAAATETTIAAPPYVPAPRLAMPGQPPRPYRHFDFTQPSPFGVIVTYQQGGRVKQVYTYPGYRNGMQEPAFLFYGDPYSRFTQGTGYGGGTGLQ